MCGKGDRSMRAALTFGIVIAVFAGCAGGNVPALLNRPANQPAQVRSADVPIVGGCQIFPANHWWDTDISQYPLDKLSDQYIAALPGNLHPDFGQDPHYG